MSSSDDPNPEEENGLSLSLNPALCWSSFSSIFFLENGGWVGMGDPSLQTDLDPGPRAREEPFRPRRMPTAPGVRERETKLYLALEWMEKKKRIIIRGKKLYNQNRI
ncbi:hypothetical protein CDAR_515561 [Caerostris darwini]|uniref:Uncharacterized protein n=1 Tax=Caerostris darwini TaxID=1538125 RepID=A0AAV4S1E5_9ARAC|nr:hypothetical protein CDAR_515561 [Caerostris darwini]